MPARMLQVLPQEMDRQVGCMAGMFQIFDRHHLLSGRRGGGSRQLQNALPPGHALPNGGSNVQLQNSSTPNITLDKTFSKSTTENSSLSLEFSGSSCSSSSFSSLDSNKSIEKELPYLTEEFFVRRPLKSSPSLKGSRMETKCSHPKTGFRDIVKDSINRDSRGLTVKTTAKEGRRSGVYKDSPRPVLPSKSMDGIYVTGTDRSTRVPKHDHESIRPSRVQPRFSCDDRQLLRPPVEAQQSKKPTAKLRELPRLSLDSRKESMGPRSRLKDFGYARTDDTLLDTLKHQESPSHRRSGSVVAKLMGLEEVPDICQPARSPRPVQSAQNERLSCSPRSAHPDAGASQLKDQFLAQKTKPSPRILAEAAPWRQQERGVTNSGAEAELTAKTASVYADIERRLGAIELSECSKDLRALRILGALHAMDIPCQNGSNARSKSIQKAADEWAANSENFRSPIVIVKPARTTAKLDVSFASASPVAGLKSLRKLRSSESSFSSKNENCAHGKTHSRIAKAHSRAEEPVGSANSPRHSFSLSPRLMQKQADSERRSRLPVPPMSLRKKSNEAVSPRGRVRSNLQAKYCHDDYDVLQVPESKIILSKHVDCGTMDYRNPLGVNSSFICQSNAVSTPNHEECSPILSSDKKKIHPVEKILSPVSVLDTSLYHDMPAPSLKKISDSFKDGERHSSDECWNPTCLPDTLPSKTSAKVNQTKPERLEAPIQKLQKFRLLSDETPNTTGMLPSATANRDHQYLYEILSASGLLHKELNFTATSGQLLPSGYPINPELFVIIEQTKPGIASETLHRRLIFDLANEIIARKMDFAGATTRQVQFLRSKKLNGWQLFKDLCAEIDGLQTEASIIKCSEEEEEDENTLLAENTVGEMKAWENFNWELQGMVLSIERSIFKDLVDEVISGEAAEKMQFRQWKLRRQLSFSSVT